MEKANKPVPFTLTLLGLSLKKSEIQCVKIKINIKIPQVFCAKVFGLIKADQKSTNKILACVFRPHQQVKKSDASTLHSHPGSIGKLHVV